MENDKVIKVTLTDDHVLLRKALATLLNDFGGIQVIHQCSNGIELIENIKLGNVPDVILLDLNMPKMNGLETATIIQNDYPEIHVLMLTMYDSELSMIRLLQAGVKGFLKKDIHPEELKFAIQSVVQSGYYYSSHSTGKLMNLFKHGVEGGIALYKSLLTELELEFLKLACSDLT
jgi:two-component system invasion response regulator UvrY